jgi:hypothetical protein
MTHDGIVGRSEKIPQTPGCLPDGYDEDSLLTLEQFALWKQLKPKTVLKRLPLFPRLIRHSKRDIRFHVKTHLDKVLKRTSNP